MNAATLPQGQIIIAKRDFGMKRSARGRAAQVRQGDRFWVTNAVAGRATAFGGLLTIDREGKGTISNGFALSADQVAEFFEIAA